MGATRNLIFDLGLFDGSDTEFYLAKGFHVVAVEARADLCAHARQRFREEIKRGTLTLVERAIWREEDQRIPFYVRSGWSSAFRQSAERDGGSGETIEVLTTTLERLFHDFATPHFMKVDVEGAEQIVVESLARSAVRPTFISVEDPGGGVASQLHALGYDRFQIVNQGYLPRVRCPRVSREGKNVTVRFNGRCSGLFGYDLPQRRWIGHDRLQEQVRFWNRLREGEVNPLAAYACRRAGKLTNRGWLVGRGWIDIHATTASTLSRRALSESNR